MQCIIEPRKVMFLVIITIKVSFKLLRRPFIILFINLWKMLRIPMLVVIIVSLPDMAIVKRATRNLSPT
jgi:hypothetical protein